MSGDLEYIALLWGSNILPDYSKAAMSQLFRNISASKSAGDCIFQDYKDTVTALKVHL